MNLNKIIIAICSVLFITIGIDKFVGYLDPPCSLQSDIPVIIWKILGVLQIGAGFLIWLPKYRKHVVGFFLVFMLVFMTIHLVVNTSDVGGAMFMIVLLGLLTWNPPFMGEKTNL